MSDNSRAAGGDQSGPGPQRHGLQTRPLPKLYGVSVLHHIPGFDHVAAVIGQHLERITLRGFVLCTGDADGSTLLVRAVLRAGQDLHRSSALGG